MAAKGFQFADTILESADITRADITIDMRFVILINTLRCSELFASASLTDRTSSIASDLFFPTGSTSEARFEAFCRSLHLGVIGAHE